MALWVIGGVAGSGKTSLGRRLSARLGCAFLDADAFHPPANLEKMRAGLPLDEDDRRPWLDALCKAADALGETEAVLAFPALKNSHRLRLRRAQPGARFAFLKADVELIRKRLQARGGFFPESLASSQLGDWEPDPEALALDACLPLDTLEESLLAWARPPAPDLKQGPAPSASPIPVPPPEKFHPRP